MIPKKLTKKPVAEKGEEVRQIAVAPCSLSFSRDAKGLPKWDIKLYGERSDMQGILDQVLELDKELRSRG